MFFGKNPEALVVVTEAVSDDIRQYFASACHQRDTPAVSTTRPTRIYVEYLDVIFPKPGPQRRRQRFQG